MPLKGYLKPKYTYCGCICMSFLFGPFFPFFFSRGRGFEGEGIFGGGLVFCLWGAIYGQTQVPYTCMSYRCSADLTSSIIYLDMLKALIHT